MKLRWLVLLSCVLLPVLLLAKTDVSALVKAVGPAIVSIVQGNSSGSGFIINPQGYVLTNSHVVGSASKVRVGLSREKRYDGDVIYNDAARDIAIIRLPVHNLPALVVGNPKALAKGQVAVAIGFPLGLPQASPTEGIISGVDVRINGQSYLQTDAALNPGNSGGPLLDDQGRVLGINTFVLKDTANIGFAIPIDVAVNALEQQHIAVTVTDFDGNPLALRQNNAAAPPPPGMPFPPGIPASPAPRHNALQTALIAIGALLVLLLAIVLVAKLNERRHSPRLRKAVSKREPDIEIELH